MLISYKRSQGSIILRCKILNSSVATGAGLTGLTSASTGLIIATAADNEATAVGLYTVAGSTIESITTLGTYAAPTATKCRFKEFDSTNHKGVYEIQIADARFAVSSAKSLLVSISGATNCAETDFVVPLTDVDPYDSVRGGMTSLPSAAAGANAGLPVLSSSATTLAYIISSVSGAVGSVTGAVGSVTGAVGSVTGNVGGNVGGSVASVIAGVTLGNTSHGGAASTLTLQSVSVSNSAGNAVTISSTGANGHGMYISGNGSGDGVHFLGGLTGMGLLAQGGATSGDGIKAQGAGTGVDIRGSITGTFNGSLTGTVGSVTGAVGSVTGDIGGNVNGNVVGNVSGSVGSVTGAVGSVAGSVASVTGNVGGNVVGSVASVAGSVGSVTGNVGGDVSGKVLGGGVSTISGSGVIAASVTGAVGSVTGSVGSVVGDIGGFLSSYASTSGKFWTLDVEGNPQATAVAQTQTFNIVNSIDAIIEADLYTDTDVTPWAVVHMTKGSGPPGTGTELLRKKVYTVSGIDLTSTDTVVGRLVQ